MAFDYQWRTVVLPDGSTTSGLMTSEEAENLVRGGSTTGYGTFETRTTSGFFGGGSVKERSGFKNGRRIY